MCVGCSCSIGFVVFDVGNFFFVDVVCGVEVCVDEDFFVVLFGNSDENFVCEDNYLDLFCE